jgi:(E)-4-hydroxy-3-methylbut-2-enyl-diphosphate synthase
MRRRTRPVYIGGVKIGDNAPVAVQGMTKTDTRDIKATVSEIKKLQKNRCQIVRVAVPDKKAAESLEAIKKAVKIPVVADIHFNWELAVESIKAGVDGLRLNPGNINKISQIKEIVSLSKERKIPIRIGLNSGSIPRLCPVKKLGTKILNKGYNKQALEMAAAALEYIKILEKLNYNDIIISLKSSEVPVAIEAYEIMASLCSYPFHLGITAAGLKRQAIIRSAIGIGTLLWQGIGDTVRVSITGPAVEEIRVAYEILEALDLEKQNFNLISCPTCGRCSLDIEGITSKIERFLKKSKIKNLKVAVMGCSVNGPGEAKQADIGIAGGKNSSVLFKKGKIVKKVNKSKIIETLIEEIKKIH